LDQSIHSHQGAKDGSTAATLQCSTSQEVKLITKQMSHTAAVHEQYYEMVGSTSHTASIQLVIKTKLYLQLVSAMIVLST
jgi:hypothetical protein